MKSYCGVDLKAMEKMKEEHDLEMSDDDVVCDVDLHRSRVSSTSSACVKDEEREKKWERWVLLRNSLKGSLRFMQFVCKYWPKYGIFLEYEIEQSMIEKSGVVPEERSDDLSFKGDDDLDPEYITTHPIIVRWVVAEIFKLWPGFDPLVEDEFTDWLFSSPFTFFVTIFFF